MSTTTNQAAANPPDTPDTPDNPDNPPSPTTPTAPASPNPPARSSARRRRWWLAGYRLLVLLAALWLVHSQHRWWRAQLPIPFDLDQVRSLVPEAASLSSRDPEGGGWYVLNERGDSVGYAMVTLPEAEHIIGYSGPNQTLVVTDRNRRPVGALPLSSGDTREHFDKVVGHERFWRQFTADDFDPAAPPVVVSGATLTSDAVARGLRHRLGTGNPPSFLFPAPIELTETLRFFPEAAALRGRDDRLGGADVLDDEGNVLGIVLRTSPASDPVIGYQGPAESIAALDADGETVVGVRLRNSFDNQPYVLSVIEDPFFLERYEGRSVERVAREEFEDAELYGVAGATLTSWALAEGLRLRLAPVLEADDELVDARQGWLAVQWSWRDAVLGLVIVGALAMALTPLRGRPRVRLAWQWFLVIVVGLVTSDMISQGLIIGWARHGVPWTGLIGLAALVLVSLAAPWTGGRQLYCHHICPHGAAQQLLGRFSRWQWRVPQRWLRRLERLPGLLLAFIFIAAVLLLPVDFAALEPFDAWVIGVAGAITLAVAAAGLVASMFVPLAFCRFGCPTGALFKFLRSTGAGDRFRWRDLAAGGLILFGMLALWQRESWISW